MGNGVHCSEKECNNYERVGEKGESARNSENEVTRST